MNTCEYKKPSILMRAKWAAKRLPSMAKNRLQKALFRAAISLSDDSNSGRHARRELQAVGYKLDEKEEGPNKWIVENVLDLLAVFSMQGHSGFSAPHCIETFRTLAKFEPLCPLTGEPDEWSNVGDSTWQNKRCSHVFKDSIDGPAYDMDGRIFREPSGSCYTSRDSRVYVTFPYSPVREYVDVPA
jgi:hypothetical protein